MTLRAGNYNASRPRPRGVIRNDGSPWYACSHRHDSFREASTCALKALPLIKAWVKDQTLPFPTGWHDFNQVRDTNL